ETIYALTATMRFLSPVCLFFTSRCILLILFFFFFFFNDPATTEIYTLSLHDALPIWTIAPVILLLLLTAGCTRSGGSSLELASRSEEHTSELQSRFDLVCRLLLEKKKKKKIQTNTKINTPHKPF